LDTLLHRKETLCSSAPSADVRVIDVSAAPTQGGPDNSTNVAVGQDAKQSSTVTGNDAKFAADGNTSGDNTKVPIAHTQNERNPCRTFKLKGNQLVQEVQVWNGTEY